jgi:hypothetical protein
MGPRSPLLKSFRWLVVTSAVAAALLLGGRLLGDFVTIDPVTAEYFWSGAWLPRDLSSFDDFRALNASSGNARDEERSQPRRTWQTSNEQGRVPFANSLFSA